MNDIGDIYVMDLEKDDDGTIYAIVYDDEDSVQYFVKVDLNTGNLTEIKELARDSNSNFYHCMALIPANKLN
ncbi:MAG: PepSY domain-containing protein [Bacteroidales bacterium]|nr:PepSY domain-containing protein [Bacteroidales bacterium]